MYLILFLGIFVSLGQHPSLLMSTSSPGAAQQAFSLNRPWLGMLTLIAAFVFNLDQRQKRESTPLWITDEQIKRAIECRVLGTTFPHSFPHLLSDLSDIGLILLSACLCISLHVFMASQCQHLSILRSGAPRVVVRVAKLCGALCLVWDPSCPATPMPASPYLQHVNNMFEFLRICSNCLRNVWHAEISHANDTF